MCIIASPCLRACKPAIYLYVHVRDVAILYIRGVAILIRGIAILYMRGGKFIHHGETVNLSQ